MRPDNALRCQSFNLLGYDIHLIYSYNFCVFSLNNFWHICLKETVKYLTEQSG